MLMSVFSLAHIQLENWFVYAYILSFISGMIFF